jgi:hypothetical protein
LSYGAASPGTSSELDRKRSGNQRLIIDCDLKLGRTRSRWGDNIRMDLREIGWGGMDWINVAQYKDRWRAFLIL